MFSIGQKREFLIISSTNEVQIGKQKVKLTPKEMGVLVLLNEHNGATVTRSELLEKVWEDGFANDQGLTQAISRLRLVLSPCKDVTITTIPKKGYLLQKSNNGFKHSGLGVISINLNTVLVAFLVLVICVLVFIQRIEIRIDKVKLDPKKESISNSK